MSSFLVRASRKVFSILNLSLNHCKDLDIRSRLDHREYFEVLYIPGGFVTRERTLTKHHRRYPALYLRLFAGLSGSPFHAQENPLFNRGRGL
jgi:hypothetical protein